MSREGGKGWQRIIAVSVMTILTISMIGGHSQAVVHRSDFGPCVQTSTEPPYLVIAHCSSETSVSLDAPADVAEHPLASGSAAFVEVEATSTGTSVSVNWTFDQQEVDSEVRAFHVDRGLAPEIPSTMERVDSVGPSASSYLDERALAEGEPFWYVVTAELADGTMEQSHPFAPSGISYQTG